MRKVIVLFNSDCLYNKCEDVKNFRKEAKKIMPLIYWNGEDKISLHLFAFNLHYPIFMPFVIIYSKSLNFHKVIQQYCVSYDFAFYIYSIL